MPGNEDRPGADNTEATESKALNPQVDSTGIDYALERGWPVFPCHSIRNGQCTCPAGPACESPGKHPRTKNGVKDATSDPATIQAWLTRWPGAINWAVATGGDGPDVVDIDTRKNGFASLKEWTKDNGLLPETLAASTGGGGRHLYFASSGLKLTNRTSWIAGVDFKTQGGYVMLPGSNHISGGTYNWVTPVHELAEMPSHLVSALMAHGSGAFASVPDALVLSGVPEGKRDDYLFKWSARKRRQGLSREEVEILVLAAARKCQPPFPDDQALKCVTSAFNYANTGVLANDDGNALEFADQHQDVLRYVGEIDRWRVWDGRRWDSNSRSALIDLARQTARSLTGLARGVDDDERKKTALKWAATSLNVQRIEAMPRLAKSDKRLTALLDEFDANPLLLNCMSGMVDLRTGALLPHDSGAMQSKMAPIEYQETAEAPGWRAWIDWAMGGDSQLVEFLQRAVGYSLTGSTDEQVIFLLHGEGANGKSTFLDAMGLLLGDYHWTAARSLLVRTNSEATNAIADLHGRRFVTASESREGRVWDEETVKSLTGDDSVTARRLYQDNFSFQPTHKIWVAANHRPVITDDTYGMWRRMLLVPWTQRVEEAQRRRGLHKLMVAKEGPGILRWAVEGALKWQGDGLQVPDVVRAKTEAYKKEQDTIGQFIEECLVKVDGGFVLVDSVVDAYKRSTYVGAKFEPTKFKQKVDARLGERTRKNLMGHKLWGWEGWELAT